MPAGEVDAVRRYLARRWCWPPEIALPDCVHWLSVPAARIASRRLPAEACGALVWRFDADAQALAAVQLEALAADGQRLTAWPSSSSTPIWARSRWEIRHGGVFGVRHYEPSAAPTPWKKPACGGCSEPSRDRPERRGPERGGPERNYGSSG